VSARVWFQQDAGAHYDPATQLDAVSGYPEFCAAGTLGTRCATSKKLYNYGFADFAGFPNTHDVGVLILDQPIAMPEYGQLPAPGTLDGLDTARGNKKTVFTVSGYGLTLSANARYASEQWGTMNERPNTLVKSSTFFDASVAYEFGAENRYSLTAWGENLTAEKTCYLLGDLDGFTWTNACQPNEGTALPPG